MLAAAAGLFRVYLVSYLFPQLVGTIIGVINLLGPLLVSPSFGIAVGPPIPLVFPLVCKGSLGYSSQDSVTQE